MIHHVTDTERAQAAEIERLRAATDYVIRRLQVDVDDASRPDHWSMVDMIKTLRAAMKEQP